MNNAKNMEMLRMNWSEQLSKYEEIALPKPVQRRKPRDRMVAGHKAEGMAQKFFLVMLREQSIDREFICSCV